MDEPTVQPEPAPEAVVTPPVDANHTPSPARSSVPSSEMKVLAPDEDEDDQGGDGRHLDLPDDVESLGHAELARQDCGDDDAYGMRPDISWMRTAKAEAELRVEEALVLSALRR